MVLVSVCAHMYCFRLCWACDIEGDGDERKRNDFFEKEEIGRREFFYYWLLVLVFRRSIG